MSVGIGLRVGSIVSHTVIASNDAGTPDPIVIVRDTVLHVGSDGSTVLGGAGQDGATEHTLSGFLSRVGEPEGVAASDGTRYRAEDVVATAISSLLHECEPLPDHGGRDGGTPHVWATYPSNWDPETVADLRESLDYGGMPQITLVSDAEATCAWFESEVAEQPGQLIGTYHADDAGTSVSLVRSGVLVGRSFRFPAGSGTSPTAQLSTALGAFGWLPSNLDAVIVTGDGLVARDTVALKGVATALTDRLGVHSVVGPGPEQAAALGAAILAAGFQTPAMAIRRIGLPPSYDVTEVISAIPGSVREVREVTDAHERSSLLTASAVGAIQAVSDVDPDDDQEGDDGDAPSGGGRPLVLAGALALIAAVALIGAVLVFLL
ncbi:hypothetical protein [Rhodococcus maanshanensis]|uniref:Hsp70 protein n=1 Tax=Rhodococcus maanshanensis TaxID=183556 RepID=A0A1H7KD90_9NOCA|nr:hypothetical protein [Rhodococcus maanshanensis]SEK84813.1 hypothetical protein SAMN05444583_10419 [Rhodococcus maanshanensis]